MKKFEFRLASVLRLRETQFTAEKEKLAQLFAERTKLEVALQTVREERRQTATWLQQTPNPTSADLRAFSAFLLGSKGKESTMQQAIEGCNAEIVEQRQKTLLAERNQKLLLKLREKKRAEWQYAFDQELELVAQEAWQSANYSRGH